MLAEVAAASLWAADEISEVCEIERWIAVFSWKNIMRLDYPAENGNNIKH